MCVVLFDANDRRAREGLEGVGHGSGEGTQSHPFLRYEVHVMSCHTRGHRGKLNR